MIQTPPGRARWRVLHSLSPAARAFLALGDEPHPQPDRRPVLHPVLAAGAAAVLALAAPLAWSPGRGADLPPATAAKGAAVEEADDDGDGAVPPPDGDA